MKRTALIIFFLLVVAGPASAQQTENRFRPKYNNFSFVSQKMVYNMKDIGMNVDLDLMKSDFGFAFTTGRSYILHPNPIAGMIRIGLDATWFDINYTHYKMVEDGEKVVIHQGDIGMGIGPSVHVSPIAKLGVHTYFRYNPTFASMFEVYDGVGISVGYSSVLLFGGAVSWGVISLGVEGRWGYTTYKSLGSGNSDEDDLDDFITSDKMKLKSKGVRAYISFRF